MVMRKKDGHLNQKQIWVNLDIWNKLNQIRKDTNRTIKATCEIYLNKVLG